MKRAFINTSYSKMVRLYGKPLIENGKLSWNITVNNKDYIVYDYLPFESTQFMHKWRVELDTEENVDFNELEMYLNSQ